MDLVTNTLTVESSLTTPESQEFEGGFGWAITQGDKTEAFIWDESTQISGITSKKFDQILTSPEKLLD